MNGATGNGPHLADIHMPAPVPAFPWAPGWWLLLALGLLALAALFWLWRRRHRQRAFRRQALAELSAMAELDDDHLLAQRLNPLLRRVAMHTHPAEDVAAVSGERWVALLSREGLISRANAEALVHASYNPRATLTDRQQLLRESEQWIRRHRGGAHV